MKFQLLPTLSVPFPTLLGPPAAVLGFQVQAFLELLAFPFLLVEVLAELSSFDHTTKSSLK